MTKRGEARKRDEQKRQLDGMTPRTPPTSEAYREGWERIFGGVARNLKAVSDAVDQEVTRRIRRKLEIP